jgi:TP901 family phage tail tape measure protein
MKREVVIELQLQDQDAVNKLGKLEIETKQYQQELRALNAEIKKNGSATAEQVNKVGELNARIRNAQGQVRELKNDVSGLTAANLRFRDKMAQASLEALKQSGILGQLQVSADNLAKEFREGRITQAQFEKGIKDINAQIGAQGKFFKQGIADLKNYAMGFVGTIAILQGAIAFFGNLARTVADFDKALSGIRALGGEYAANIGAIGEAAKTAGINFGFSATESLGAVEALAKAGVSTADILGGGLTGALTLAAAGQLDVATAAETASKAMTQFGLAGEDIPHLADLLAAGAASATGEVTDFAQALNQGGLVASQMGISIEETIGTLTAFASAGLIGSDAGTSFRTMLQRLAKPSKEAADRMKELGINAFDAQGNFVGLEKFAGELREGFADLTEEQRANATVTIFGSDAQRAANVLYTQGAEGIAAYTEEIDKAGFSTDVATEQTQNLSGAVDRAKETWNAFVLGIEDGSGIIGKAVTGVVNIFADLVAAVTTTKDVGLEEFSEQVGEVLKKTGQFEKVSFFDFSTQKSVQELQQLVASIKDYGNSASQIILIEQDRAKLAAELDAIGTKALTNQQIIRKAALQAAIDALDKDISKRKEALTVAEKATETTDTNTEGTEKNTEAVKTQAAAVRVLTDRLREFQQLQEQLESGQGIGPMAVINPTAEEAAPGVPLGPSPAVQAALEEGQAMAEATAAESLAFQEAYRAKIAVAEEFADALGGLTQLLGEQTAAGKTFATAQALINTYLGVTQILANETMLPEPAGTIQKTLAVAGTLATGLAAVRRIQGFAEGGVVQQADGPRYTANRGDSVLISAAPGEVVLTRNQQLRLKALAGHRIFNDIGVPGFASGGLVRGTALANMPRTPSSGAVANAELSRAINSIDMSPVVRVTEIMDVMRSVQVAQSAASL